MCRRFARTKAKTLESYSEVHMTAKFSLKILFITLVALLILQQYAKSQVQDTRATPAQPSVELPGALSRVLTDYEEAWSSRNAGALSRLFAEDGFVLPNGFPPARGRAEIERFYTGQGGPLSLRAFAFAAEGKVGYIIGGYASKKGEPDTGKFTLTLRKGADGKWMIMSDMDSSNRRR
jgi:ketosteroid isomerase-like protein